MRPQDRVMPLPAVVGQESARLALLLLAVHPGLGGVLIRGEKGTAKSTLARGLARVLPAVHVNRGCRLGCIATRPADWCDDCKERSPAAEECAAPFENLPLGITEDQLLGSLDLEHALQQGRKRFEPGLLARVHGGVLYVDEVNLLEDHIVDLLLDAAVTRVNVVSREGVTVSHPAEFLLVGTMNPEEGELRPQLTDRFGLCAEIDRIEDPAVRAEIVQRCLAFEEDPERFRETWADEEQRMMGSIAAARQGLARVTVDRSWFEAAGSLSVSLGVDGHRADLLLIKGAAALAAFEGRERLEPRDIERVAPLVYAHRLRRRPFEESSITADDLREQVAEVLRASDPRKKKSHLSGGDPEGLKHHAPRPGGAAEEAEEMPADGSKGPSLGWLDGGLFATPSADVAPAGAELEGWFAFDSSPAERAVGPVHTSNRRGGRASVQGPPFRGRSVRTLPAGEVTRDLAWTASLLAAAVRPRRPPAAELSVVVGRDDLRRRDRRLDPGRLLLFAVDISGSMGGELMDLSRRIALDLLRDAYVRRDRIAMLAFRGREAHVLFGPTDQAELVRRALVRLPCGGTTPLAAGLQLSHQLLVRSATREPARRQVLVVVSDGRANVGSRPGQEAILTDLDGVCGALVAMSSLRVVLLDATEAGKNDYPARRLTRRLGAERILLHRLGDGIDHAVRAAIAEA